MLDAVEEQVAVLRKTGGGWVHRRDAAEDLGKGASRAIEVLLSHREDRDVDVRSGVGRALAWVQASLRGVPAAAASTGYTLEELVRGVERPGKREVEKIEGGYRVTVTTGKGRKQVLSIATDTRRDGKGLIRVSTRCGAGRETTRR